LRDGGHDRLVNVFDGLDEMALPEDDVGVLRDVETNGF
jgi:hypothetical protein